MSCTCPGQVDRVDYHYPACPMFPGPKQAKPVTMTMNKQDQETLLLCSVRYALGRRSYIVSDVCRIVRETLKGMNDSDNIRALIIRDIGEELARGRAGDAMDEKEWRKLLEWMGVTT